MVPWPEGTGRLHGKVIFEFTLEGRRVSWGEDGGGSTKEPPADLMGILGQVTKNPRTRRGPLRSLNFRVLSKGVR